MSAARARWSLLAALLLAAPSADAQWAGFRDDSDALGTDRYPFTGPNGDPLHSHGNENYYDGDFADFDGDGYPDRALGARYGMLLNQGGGYMVPFAGRTGFLFRGMSGAAGWGEDAFQTLDADNDGDYDVLSGGNGGEPFVLQTNRAGSFATRWNTSGSTILIGLTDVEGDGDVDLATCDGGFTNRFRLWINDGNGDYTEEAVARGLDYDGEAVVGIASGDVDGDGDNDLVLHPGGAFQVGPEKVIHIALNDGTGNYTIGDVLQFAEGYTECCTGVTAFQQAFSLGDVDDDGDLDLMVSRGPWSDQGIHPRVCHSLFINDGNGDFTDESATRFSVAATVDTSGYAGNKIGGGDGKLVDLDYDGDLDFASHAPRDGLVNVFLNDGSGNFVYDDARSVVIPAPATGLGGELDVVDLNRDGTWDVWLGRGGARVRILMNTHADPAGVPADLPRNLQVVSTSGGVTLRFEAPPFAAASRHYRVYRAPAAGLEERDRPLLHIIGERHQDETFFVPITRHTTTEDLGDTRVTLDGAADAIEFTDTTATPGVTYFYSVSHVGAENVIGQQTPDIAATVGAPDPNADTTAPEVRVVAPSDQQWWAYPRVVAHYADGGSGIDPASVSVTMDQPLGGGRAAGAELRDLAYRLDGGVVIVPLQPPHALTPGMLTTVTVRASDMAGNEGMAEVTFFPSVDPDATPPVASLVSDVASGNAPLAVAFDASGSTDNGTVYRYEWYFGDGTTAIGSRVRHTFAYGGSYDVMLLVRDHTGAVDTAWTTIVVDGDAPPCTPGDPGCLILDPDAAQQPPSPGDDGGAVDAGTGAGDGPDGGAAAVDGGAWPDAGTGAGAAAGDGGLAAGDGDGSGSAVERDGGVDDASAAASDDGCGCRAPGGHGDPPGWKAVLGLGAALWLRRRRRR